MESDEPTLAVLKSTLDELWETYDNDPVMKARLVHNVTVCLPRDMTQHKNTIQQKKHKKDQLTSSFSEFVDDFLSENCYYFLPATNLFIQYDDVNFSIVEEDDIQHKLFTRITPIAEFTEHKTKLKTFLIRTIKERTLTSTIPESETIQKSISTFFPFVFRTKHEAQYFLTVLGDNILRKNDNLVHIVDSTTKQFMSLLSEQFSAYLGNAVALSSFKFKYYDQAYSSTRLLRTNHRIYLPDIWRQSLPGDFLNIIAVACHYSVRFGDSDGFLNKKCNPSSERSHIHFLKDNTPESIVSAFKSEMVSDSHAGDSRISQKNMLYLWKSFLEKHDLPAIMFVNNFKSLSRQLMTYDEPTDSYLRVTSKHLPVVGNFLEFWDAHMTTDTDDQLDELEIEEICYLFKSGCSKVSSNALVAEKEILSLIEHFYPDVEVTEGKLIRNTKCSLWDKQVCIAEFLDQYRAESDSARVTLRKLYKAYCKSEAERSRICSKAYFDSVIKERYQAGIENKCTLKEGWC